MSLLRKQFHPGLAALLEVGLLFLPAIPAYLWVWPNLDSRAGEVFQIITYIYVLAGALAIGLRRWSPSELGLNRKGLGLSLACGGLLLAGRLLIILSVAWEVYPPPLTHLRLLGNILFYFGLVGLVEELLFRGLIYRALEDWRNARWAIWGSSLGFLLWHIFGQGPLIGIATLFIGLIFALFRWRTGGIAGLIAIHALWDLETVLLVASSSQEIMADLRPAIPYPGLMFAGLGMLLLAPLYLWLLHPTALRLLHRKAA